MVDKIVRPWIQGTDQRLKYAGSTKLVNCFITEDNNYFKANSIAYTEQTSYSYQSGSPTLRQFINQYAPLTDRNAPAEYIAQLYKTLKANGVGITSIDEPMSNYIKL